ncbi:MAG: L-serine ammonia-lyase, iron-sulfur-dependent, subunit alpha, partial [Bacillota bacterium]|nr:L-serine ammonia-lyase, iron-sulfur-dependent, subunit alpha [Bacillota bacterium]
MKISDKTYLEYVKILKEELVPAMGCTEPIALAYAAAKAKEVLGTLPTHCCVEVSGNIIKNAKSVVVPNTNGLKGIGASIAAGIIAGNPSKILEVLSDIKEKDKQLIKEYQENNDIQVIRYDGDLVFYIAVVLFHGNTYAKVVIENYHTNIVLIEKNGDVLFQAGKESKENTGVADRSLLNVKDIVAFSDIVDPVDIADVVGRQIKYNSAIAAEGMTGNWGARIGNILLKTYGDDIKVRARAAAAAGSDARMGGCENPVIILSGSGNQSITA